jgi:hypothetical protein
MLQAEGNNAPGSPVCCWGWGHCIDVDLFFRDAPVDSARLRLAGGDLSSSVGKIRV